MDRQTVIALLKQQLDSGPRQERHAASFILENPQEVAVMSMRDQARLANVPPSTMTRLAKRIGLSGYDELKDIYIDSVRAKGNAYGGRAEALVELNRRIGGRGLVQDMASNAISHIQALCSDENLTSIVRATKLMASARTIYCLGMRSSYGVAFQFSHVASYFAKNVRLVEGSGESGVMAVINEATSRDVVLVSCMPRYSRRVVTLTNFLHQQGVAIVAVTDSPLSPVARFAKETIIVKNDTASFFDTVIPAMLVSEMLVALLSASSKTDIRASVSQTEQKLLGLDEWWDPQ